MPELTYLRNQHEPVIGLETIGQLGSNIEPQEHGYPGEDEKSRGNADQRAAIVLAQIDGGHVGQSIGVQQDRGGYGSYVRREREKERKEERKEKPRQAESVIVMAQRREDPSHHAIAKRLRRGWVDYLRTNSSWGGEGLLQEPRF